MKTTDPHHRPLRPPARSVRRFLAPVLAFALLAGVAGTSTAQEIPDVPSLDFSITPGEGAVGSTVEGQVDVADIDEHCITDPRDFVAQLVDPDDPLGGSPTAYLEVFEAWVMENVPDFDLGQLDPEAEFAVLTALFFPLGLALDLGDPDGGELVEGAVAQTFVMAFADLATASPIAPFGSFDRTTGDGSVQVPDLPPGTHPVIATCVGLPEEITIDMVDDAVAAGVAAVEQNLEPPYPTNPLGDEFAPAAGLVAPAILQALIEPRALGIAFYCVDDGTGSCDDDEVPPPPNGTPPGTPPGNGEGEGEGEGNGNGNGGGPGTAPGAQAVSGRPTFTG